jgi:tetratricopeptide (TPR) repeat protein
VTRISCVATLAAALVIGSNACGTASRQSAARELMPVSLPDVNPLDPAVQTQIRDAHESLQKAMHGTVTDVERAAAFGRLGMLLQAADFFEAAEPAYRNAQRLQPTDVRWPYYLGHLHKSRGNLAAAEVAFSRVLELQADDLATLIWLGRLYLDIGRPEDAGRMFARADRVAPRSIAVLAGLGQTALTQKDYTAAIRHFEQALQLDPSAESVHAPLAAAYRAAGSPEKAEPHLRQWQNRDILVPDPLHQELDMLLESGLAYELRGVRALEAKDFASAAEYFRRGLALTKENTALRRSLGHKLGTALYAAGQEAAAVEQFREVVRAAPHATVDEAAGKAHYSLGVIMLSSGDSRRAIEHFEGAVRHQPTLLEAHIALAEALRRTGQVRASLLSYQEALRISPQASQARWGYALALVHLQRHREAAEWLTAAIALHPDRPEFAHLLARVLAAAPDPAVRDGPRAMTLVQSLMTGPKTTELGETMAMALAELGEYDEAAAVQRGVLQAVRQGNLGDEARRVEANLRLYERRQPVRSVWIGEQGAQGGRASVR